MTDLNWVQQQLAGDPRELIDFHDTRAFDHLCDNGIIASMVSAEKRQTRKGEDMWIMKDTVNYRHYLFRDKFDPESELFMEWYTNDMLERLDSMKDGDTIHFDPPARMYVMKSRTNFSHVYCPAGE